jgi:hypothetical protein
LPTAAPGGLETLATPSAFTERPRSLHFSFGVIGLFVDFVVHAAVSLRGASAVLALLQQRFPEVSDSPCANAGQFWLLRIGLYELTRPKEKAADWVWLVDHTIQIGTMKCLLIVGCRLEAWQAQQRPLTHQDLQMLALEPVQESTGRLVEQQLEAVVVQTGVPRQIVCDHGSDVKCGVTAFCQRHPETANIYDIKHKTALVVKHALEADMQWLDFVGEIGRVRLRLQQTPLAHLMPPTFKSKARYMNLEDMVAWGQRALAYLEAPRPVDDARVSRQELHKKLGWLQKYRGKLAAWAEAMAVVSETLTYVRRQGYHATAKEELAQKLPPVQSPLGRRIADELLTFIADQSAQAKKGEALQGSSEVLESLIGKGKRLEGQQNKSGFTKMLLAIAAAVVQPSTDYLAAAFDKVKVRHVIDWCKEKLGPSVQAKRRRAFAACPAGTKPG